MGLVRSLGRKVASLLPYRMVVKQCDGFRIRLDTSQHVDSVLHYTGKYEPETMAAIRRLVKPGDVVVDVGANIGIVTLTLASIVGRQGRVFAYEPSDWTFDRLAYNVGLNDFPQVQAKRAAVGSVDNPSMAMTLPCGYRLDWKDTSTRQVVPIVRLDTELAGVSRLDFIKTDTDGFEPGVISGATSLLEKFRPSILTEVAPDHAREAGQSFEQMFSQLSRLGYRFQLDDGTEISDPLKPAQSLPENGSYNLIAIAN